MEVNDWFVDEGGGFEEDCIIIKLSTSEARLLTEELISKVGWMKKPNTIAEKITDKLCKRFPEEK